MCVQILACRHPSYTLGIPFIARRDRTACGMSRRAHGPTRGAGTFALTSVMMYRSSTLTSGGARVMWVTKSPCRRGRKSGLVARLPEETAFRRSCELPGLGSRKK